MEDLEAMLEKDITTTDTLYTKADVEVTIHKEETNEETQEEEKVLGNDSLSDGETTEDQEVKTGSEESTELTKEEFAAKCKKEAMEKLGEFEELENQKVVLNGEITKASQELEALFSKVRAANIELVNKINELNNEFEVVDEKQQKIKDELLPLQKEIYLVNDKDKTLVYNKIQSTYVAPTVKNQFDLKKFREEQEDFWKEHYDVMKNYAKITDVSAYLKITIKE